MHFNAVSHGILSGHTVLACEDPNEYRAVLEGLGGRQPAAEIPLAGCMTEARQRLFPEAGMPDINEAHSRHSRAKEG